MLRAIFILAAAAAAGEPRLDAAKAKGVRDDTPEAERVWPSAAIGYLLGEAEKPEVSAYAEDLARLAAEPPGRFAFVWFRGRLEEMKEEDGIFRGRVADGERAVVFVTRRPALEVGEAPEPPRLIEDGFVRVRGIFVKRYRADERPAFLVVATGVERDYATKPVRTLGDVGLDAVKDDDGEPPSRTYPSPLMRLVKLAEAGAPDDAAPEAFDAADFAAPAKLRGRLVGGTGIVVVEPLHLARWHCEPNDAGVDGYVTGWILSDGKKLLQFVAPERLKGIGEERDAVRFTGFFYKLRSYAARNGTTRVAPLLVLTDLVAR